MNSYWYLRVLFLLVVLVVSFGSGFRIQAAPEVTFIVNTTTDTHDVNPGQFGCADATGKCSLRAAIEEANALAGVDTITLPAGTYNLNSHLSISEGLTINGGGETSTIINGATPATSGGIQNTAGNLTLNNLTIQHFYFGLYISGSTARTITLENVTIQNNSHTDTNNSGAGIRQYCAACTLNLSNADIKDNTAPACAGISNSGTVNISNNSRVSGNTATSTIGGGICNKGALAVSQSFINNNGATAGTDSFGGGINHTGSSLTIFLSEMYSNYAYMGGALYDSGDDISIQFSSIFGNSATSGGGGVFLGIDGSVYMDHASLTNNDSAYGGGIYSYAGDAEIRHSTVVSNTSTVDGGGIYVQDGVMTVINSTISGNQADHDGGGVFVKYGGVKLASTTLSNNTADMDDNGDGIAGGIYVHDSADDVRFKNTIIAGNEDLTTSPFEIYYPDCLGDLISDGFNLVGRVTVLCNISGDLSGNQIGIGSAINPGLGGLIQGSYDAYYHPLVWFSPAVNRGNPAGCKDYDNITIDDDQPGETRHWGRCDVGAVESHINRKDLYLPVALR